MPRRWETIEKTRWKVKSIFEVSAEDPTLKTLKCKIDWRKKEIIVYTWMESPYLFNFPIIFKWTNKISDVSGLQKKWYISSSIWYYLAEFLLSQSWIESDFGKLSVVVSKTKATAINEDMTSLVLSYEDYRAIHQKIYSLKSWTYLSNCKKNFLSRYLSDKITLEYAPTERDKKAIATEAIENIDSWMAPYMTEAQKEKLENIYQSILDTWYVEQIEIIKRWIDTSFLDYIIEKFNKYLDNVKTSEAKWGKFLEDNLFLLWGRYIECIKEINVEDESERKVDFWLIDTASYLDIYEIKKPTTQLLSKSINRGNHYRHSKTVQAIVQAEKYLYDIERNAVEMEKRIEKRLKKKKIVIKFKIKRPRAYLIIGSSEQLDTDKKRNDFQILRRSLKNIEIVLYDELLKQLENQRNRFTK